LYAYRPGEKERISLQLGVAVILNERRGGNLGTVKEGAEVSTKAHEKQGEKRGIVVHGGKVGKSCPRSRKGTYGIEDSQDIHLGGERSSGSPVKEKTGCISPIPSVSKPTERWGYRYGSLQSEAETDILGKGLTLDPGERYIEA